MVTILTAGTAFVMWLAELITQRGVGQGMSLLIFANVVAGLPSGGKAVYAEGGPVKFWTIVALSLALLVLIVFMDNGQRRIPVTFARRVVGRREMGGNSTYIPLKVNQSGVIPIIFASSVLYIPVLMANVVPWAGFQDFVNSSLHPTSFFYILSDFLLIMAFTFFYVYIAFEPHQQAEMLRQQGGFVPGIRPGLPTERYFARMLSRITVVGATLPRVGGGHAEPGDGALEHQPIPVLRDHPADRGRRGARDDAPDRQPAHDAQLRGLPQALTWPRPSIW